MSIKGLFILCALVLTVQSQTLWGEKRPPIAISRDAKSRISQLKFGWPKFIRVPARRENEGAKFYVKITGDYPIKNWQLFANGEKVNFLANRKFELRVPIQARITQLRFQAAGPRGERQKETLSIYVIDWDGLLESNLFNRPTFEVIPAIGFSYFSYQQTDTNDFGEYTLAGKLSLNYVFAPPNWSASALISGTLFAFSASDVSTTLRLVNIDLVTGYTFRFGESGLSASLLPGFQYKHTIVTDNAFGYFNLAGPVLYTNLNYQFGEGDAIAIYLKLGPIVRGGRLLSLRNFEFAQGVGPVFLLKNGHVMPVMLETSFLTLDVDGRTANAFNAMLTLGYSL